MEEIFGECSREISSGNSIETDQDNERTGCCRDSVILSLDSRHSLSKIRSWRINFLACPGATCRQGRRGLRARWSRPMRLQKASFSSQNLVTTKQGRRLMVQIIVTMVAFLISTTAAYWARQSIRELWRSQARAINRTCSRKTRFWKTKCKRCANKWVEWKR